MPEVQVTVKHNIPNQKQDAMNVWIENVTTSQFEVCLRESRTFDGPHNNLAVVCHINSAVVVCKILPPKIVSNPVPVGSFYIHSPPEQKDILHQKPNTFSQ